jgi:hypothetical protein
LWLLTQPAEVKTSRIRTVRLNAICCFIGNP